MILIHDFKCFFFIIWTVMKFYILHYLYTTNSYDCPQPSYLSFQRGVAGLLSRSYSTMKNCRSGKKRTKQIASAQYSILFYSILFCSILFSSILFCFILFYSVLFYSILFESILFYYIIFDSILF
jgi:hypothetical protein